MNIDQFWTFYNNTLSIIRGENCTLYKTNSPLGYSGSAPSGKYKMMIDKLNKMRIVSSLGWALAAQ